MNPKHIITGVLLLFVAGSVTALIIKKSCESTPPSSQQTAGKEAELKQAPGQHIIVYYLHGNKRCYTCEKMEKLTREAVQSGFKNELKVNGFLELRILNTDKPEHTHFIKDFQLHTKSVVVVEMDGNKIVRFTNLEKIWDLVSDDGAFITYIQDGVRAYLEKG